MLTSILERAGRRAARWSVVQARCYWRRFRIDDPGHGDWEHADAAPEQRTIQIRFSKVPESMIDALHGLRAIERQFGRIREYRLLRDSEIRSGYQAICWAAFESHESLLRVSPLGTTLKVMLPPRLGWPEGGLGLDNIQDLLEPENRSRSKPSSSLDESSRRFVTLSIKRSGTPITFRSTARPPFRSRAMKAAIGHGFLEWGGFAPLKPLYESSPFTSPAKDPSSLDSKNMRLALNKWSQILNVPDPLFPDMKHSVDAAETLPKDTDSDWEPLSEMETDPAEELEMPQTTRESLKQSLEGLLQRSDPNQGTDKP